MRLLGSGLRLAVFAVAAAASCDGPPVELPVRRDAKDASAEQDAAEPGPDADTGQDAQTGQDADMGQDAQPRRDADTSQDADADQDAQTDETLIPCDAGAACQDPRRPFCAAFGSLAFCVECLEDRHCPATSPYCVLDSLEFEYECEQRRSN